MITAEQVEEVLFRSVDDFNEMQPNAPVEKSLTAALFGTGGQLDSFALVNLVVAVEQRFEEDLGESITLADERAMSQRNSPFRSLGALRDFIVARLQEVRT